MKIGYTICNTLLILQQGITFHGDNADNFIGIRMNAGDPNFGQTHMWVSIVQSGIFEGYHTDRKMFLKNRSKLFVLLRYVLVVAPLLGPKRR